MRRALLNAEDLARLTVRPWGPFNETFFSLRQLQKRAPNLVLDGWRRQAADAVAVAANPLLVMAPLDHPVDLLTVVGEAATFDEAMERLLGAPDGHLRAELEHAFLPRRNGAWARAWVRDLMDGNRRARQELVDRFRTYHREAVASHWPAVRAHLEAERAKQARVMATNGIDGLLATLHPWIRWRPPYLEVIERDDDEISSALPATLVPDGRSLVLVPSVFCDQQPRFLVGADDAEPHLLVYPVLRNLGDAKPLWAGAGSNHQAIGDLIGRTRAKALEAIAGTCTTTELAQLLGVSLATASHHATVLREARLVTSSREGSAVRHRLTDLGRAVLDGSAWASWPGPGEPRR